MGCVKIILFLNLKIKNSASELLKKSQAVSMFTSGGRGRDEGVCVCHAHTKDCTVAESAAS